MHYSKQIILPTQELALEIGGRLQDFNEVRLRRCLLSWHTWPAISPKLSSVLCARSAICTWNCGSEFVLYNNSVRSGRIGVKCEILWSNWSSVIYIFWWTYSCLFCFYSQPRNLQVNLFSSITWIWFLILLMPACNISSPSIQGVTYIHYKPACNPYSWKNVINAMSGRQFFNSSPPTMGLWNVRSQ